MTFIEKTILCDQNDGFPDDDLIGLKNLENTEMLLTVLDQKSIKNDLGVKIIPITLEGIYNNFAIEITISVTIKV